MYKVIYNVTIIALTVALWYCLHEFKLKGKRSFSLNSANGQWPRIKSRVSRHDSYNKHVVL